MVHPRWMLILGYNYNSGQPHTIANINGNNGNDYLFGWDADGNMTYHHQDNLSRLDRYQCWDEQDRLTGACDNSESMAYYIYDSYGQRTIKLLGDVNTMQINYNTFVNYPVFDRYSIDVNPFMVMTEQGYTKHYYIEGQRILSKIGAGMSYNPVEIDLQPEDISLVQNRMSEVEYGIDNNMECFYIGGTPEYYLGFDWLSSMTGQDDEEADLYFYHPDHLGSSSFITDAAGDATQHMEYLPFGEPFIEERIDWNTPYKFTGKELDEETEYYYFGARYYDPAISVWLSLYNKKESSLEYGGRGISFASQPPISIITVTESANSKIDFGDNCIINGKFDLEDRYTEKGICQLKGYFRSDYYKGTHIIISYANVSECEHTLFNTS